MDELADLFADTEPPENWGDSFLRPDLSLPPNPEGELYEAVRSKNYPRAYGCLRRLKGTLSEGWAGQCLSAALYCTPSLFRAVLERCPPGECAATEQWKLEEIGTRYVNVKGTILTIAAAMDKAEHMAILLKHGYDPNAASPASAQALRQASGINANLCFLRGTVGSGGAPDSQLTIGEAEYNTYEKSVRQVLWSTDRCTPLAAALACGSKRAARLLLKQPDVEWEHGSALCRAAVAALHYGGSNQMECLRLVFRLKSPPFCGSMNRELLCERALDLVAAAEMCTLREFSLRLRGVPCAPEEARAAADALANRDYQKRGQKLLRLLSAYPELENEAAVRDSLLALYVGGAGGKKVREELLRRWKELCGEVRDISNVKPCYLSARGVEDLREALAALGEGGTLCAAAESPWLKDYGSRELLLALFEHVRFYRASRVGISLLATLLLRHMDAKSFRELAQRGMLDGEPGEELLAYAAGGKNKLMLRAMILSSSARHSAAHGELPENGEVWSARLARMDTEAQRAWVREAWTQPLDALACKERMSALIGLTLRRSDEEESESLFGMIGREYMWQEKLDGLVFSSFSAAACCGKNPELLRVILSRCGVERGRRTWTQVSWDSGEQFQSNTLNGTMLCAAAAAGRTEQVRILLEYGFDPNELDAGFRSSYTESSAFGASFVVTPLYMALEKGHTETAQLLRRYGAVAWPERANAEQLCG